MRRCLRAPPRSRWPASPPKTAGADAATVSRRQREIWKKVTEIQGKLSSNLGAPVAAAPSRTSLQLALENGGLERAQAEYVKALQPLGEKDADIVGYVFAVNGKINSADIYPSNGLFRKMWPKLLRASVTEALGERDGTAEPAPPVADANSFLASPRRRAQQSRRTPGPAAASRCATAPRCCSWKPSPPPRRRAPGCIATIWPSDGRMKRRRLGSHPPGRRRTAVAAIRAAPEISGGTWQAGRDRTGRDGWRQRPRAVRHRRGMESRRQGLRVERQRGRGEGERQGENSRQQERCCAFHDRSPLRTRRRGARLRSLVARAGARFAADATAIV